MITIQTLQQGKPAQDVALRQFAFPGGEIQVQVQAEVAPADGLRINAHLATAADVMALLMTTDALRRAYPGLPLTLRMPYVPYARQDRVCNPGEALGARVFCDLINAQNYAQVVVMDPHSDVTPALLNRVAIEEVAPLIGRVVASLGDVALVAPDAGARKRVQALAKQLGGLPVVFAEKVRDTRTGEIVATSVVGELPNSKLLVVDDICDGGRTFIELAAALKDKQAAQGLDQSLFLYVTHGIFSKGLDVLTPLYTQVFTPNDWTGATHNALTVIR